MWNINSRLIGIFTAASSACTFLSSNLINSNTKQKIKIKNPAASHRQKYSIACTANENSVKTVLEQSSEKREGVREKYCFSPSFFSDTTRRTTSAAQTLNSFFAFRSSVRCLLFFFTLHHLVNKFKKKKNTHEIGRASHFYQYIDTLYSEKTCNFFQHSKSTSGRENRKRNNGRTYFRRESIWRKFK